MTVRDWVMDCGPWYIAGRPFVIRRWQLGMEMLNIQLTSLPIWVKFHNIPLEYLTNTIPHRELGWPKALPTKAEVPGSSLPGGYWGIPQFTEEAYPAGSPGPQGDYGDA